jgi:flavin reductase (DIM6/NTAB) family NADH-FMN oxidoreductase RutF
LTSIILKNTSRSRRRYQASENTRSAGPSGYHLVAILQYDDMAAIQKAFASAEGQVAVADVQNFATGGVTANSFMSGSLDPPLCVVSVSKTARMHGFLVESGHFGVSISPAARKL